MYDPNPDRTPDTPDERWSSLLFLLLFGGLVMAGLLQDFEPRKVAAVLVVLFWVPLLALHEAGHALMAAALGWTVGQVVIGMGNELKRFRVGGAVVSIHLYPVMGFASSVPTNLNLPHLKCALIYFAGPGIELLLAGVLLLVVGPDRLLTRSDDYLIIAVQSLALAATFQAGINLIPFTLKQGEEWQNSDGMGIIQSFLTPESHYASMIGRRFNEERGRWEFER